MASIRQFLESLEVKDFQTVKGIFQSLGLKVKDRLNLYMISFTDMSDLTNPIIREANGIIIEKDTNKIIHHCFSKTYDNFLDPYNNESYRIKYVNNFVEGSLIRVYYYDNCWNVGTSRHFTSVNNKWNSNVSFMDMFSEVVVNKWGSIEEFYTTLDTGYCYTFILSHADNNLIIPVKNNNLLQLNRVSLETLEEELSNDIIDNDISIKNLKELEDKNINYMVYFSNGDKCKILSKEYNDMKKIRNNKSILLSFITCIHEENYINANYMRFFYPECIEMFDDFMQILEDTARYIYTLYQKRYILKDFTFNELDNKYLRTMVQIHGQYKRTRKPIKIEDVSDKLLSLNPRILYSIIY